MIPPPSGSTTLCHHLFVDDVLGWNVDEIDGWKIGLWDDFVSAGTPSRILCAFELANQ